MQEYIQFIMNHWQLWLAFVILLAIVIRMEKSTHVRGVHLWTSSQITFLINQENALIVDLREDDEYRKGHLTGAIHIPRVQLPHSLNKLGSDKQRPIILITNNNQLGIQSGVLLRKQQFEKVGILKGGVHAWLAANLPLISK